MDSQTNHRIVWIDVMKGIGIIFVLLGHIHPGLIQPSYRKYIYSFHMPLFFILSGYLFKTKDIKKCIVDSLKRYIRPYAILCFINLTLQVIMDKTLLTEKGERTRVIKYIVGILYSRGTIDWMPNCSPLWFLTCIFCTFCIYNAIQITKSINKTQKVSYLYYGLIVLGCTAGVIADKCNLVKMPWNFDTALVAILFCEIGNIVREKQIIKKLKTINVLPKAVISCLIVLCFYVTSKLNPVQLVSFDDNDYGIFILSLISGVTGTAICFLISGIIENTSVFLTKILSYLGRHTIFLIGFDYFSGTVASDFLEVFGLDNNILLLFIFKLIIIIVGLKGWTCLIGYVKNPRIREALSF